MTQDVSEVLDVSAPPALVLHARSCQTPSLTAFRVRELGIWRPVTWAEYADSVADAGAELSGWGVGPGDGVLLHLGPGQTWVRFALAAEALGAVWATARPAATPDELSSRLGAGVSLVITNDDESDERVNAAAAQASWGGAVRRAAPRPTGQRSGQGALATEQNRAEFWRGAAELATAGRRPGAACSPESARAVDILESVARLVEATPRDEVLTSLDPSDHVERAVGVAMALRSGYVVNVGSGSSRLYDELTQVEPTLVVGGPAMWASLGRELGGRIEGTRGIRRALLDRGLRRDGRLWSLLVREPLCRRIGLRRARALVCVGTPADDVISTFAAAGRPLVVIDGHRVNPSEASDSEGAGA